MTQSQNIGRGAFFIIASELSFACSAAIIKLVSDSLPNESIVFFRNLFGLVILTPLLLKTDTKILQTNCLHLHLLRSGIGMGAMYCFFYGLAHLSLGDSMLIKSGAIGKSWLCLGAIAKSLLGDRQTSEKIWKFRDVLAPKKVARILTIKSLPNHLYSDEKDSF